MRAFLVVIPLISIVLAVANGSMGEVSSSIIDKAGEAVTLAISLCGIMCFWCGIMRVAEKSGLVDKLAGLLSVPISWLFRDIRKGGEAARLIAMNLSANLLGLGNASTPLGIKAMQAIAKEKQAGDTACDSMVMLTVLNTASLQLIPTTAAALRQAVGAASPMDILPCVWIVSVYSVVTAVAAAKLMCALGRRRRAKRG
ncbi:MAG: nucleoside recognition domain-containing protein [Oscillospiraceae bacterium]